MILDPEMEALVKCDDLIKGLNGESQVRVIQYLVNKYKIGMRKEVDVTSTSFDTEPSKTNQLNPPILSTGTSSSENASSAEVYPSMREIVIKGFPTTETEWCLVYGFYASNFGENEFDLEQLRDQYRASNRDSANRRKNMMSRINTLVRHSLFRSLNSTQLLLTPEGITKAKEIIFGNSNSKPRKQVVRKRSNPKKSIQSELA